MIEDFMLHCDGATVAVEVPLYLTNDEVAYYRRIGFHLPLETLERPITGHIDVLQLRRGLIHILDYKPDAGRINPGNQLLLYALALASRTRLPLKLLVCAWFDVSGTTLSSTLCTLCTGGMSRSHRLQRSTGRR